VYDFRKQLKIQKAISMNSKTKLDKVRIDNETFYRISDVDQMRPFFMSIVSESNHWMFIGSNGGISAGRKDAENALFPYYTDDKIIESVEITGSKSIFLVKEDSKHQVWEPFSMRYASLYSCNRNLYKNLYGNKIVFEEINHDLGLVFRYEWNSSNMYGFVRKCSLENTSGKERPVSIMDGLQNVLPYGVGTALQNQSSNLVDAYKRNELLKESGMGIFGLSAIIVDKAEPSEALKANIVWSLGLEHAKHLLSSLQLEDFRNGRSIKEEVDIKGEKGAYLLSKEITLPGNGAKRWMLVADVNKSISAITAISDEIIHNAELAKKVNEDIEAGTKKLIQLNASADALQLTNDPLRDTRHFSNTLFNIMRGGIFDKNYQIEKSDLINYLFNANSELASDFNKLFDQLPEEFPLSKLKELASLSNSTAFKRLCIEYLPLKFSRRHGDPSRPWNRFSINTHDERGAKILDYEGNWRDIFQNWEALAYSYPEFVEGMIFRFLNASTFDGYNPYRITKNGIDWEKIEPDDPWSYIGYWGDHQIIYLLKFLEFAESYYPGKLESYFEEDIFVYANVPYKIKNYNQLLANPKDTIDFDHELDKAISERRSLMGADGALLRDQKDNMIQVNFAEKILATLLAKMSNFIPEAGIWMNTQRPEWNDANNALVGNGVSAVTLYYIERFLTFITGLLRSVTIEKVQISVELKAFMDEIIVVLESNKGALTADISDKKRKQILDGLGEAGSAFRNRIYNASFDGEKQEIKISNLLQLTELCQEYAQHTIRANKRSDNLYHAYNLMTVVNDQEVTISRLSEMLEGQVAVLSSGYLSSTEAVEVLDSMKVSRLYRADQSSYILYPNRDLPGFMRKNTIPAVSVANSQLLKALADDGDTKIIEKDSKGLYHFNGNFRNANNLREALNELSESKYGSLIKTGSAEVLQVFEEVFNHKAFTGRSGTFFGYEGLGSIYWHMVSKLALSAQECCLKAIRQQENEEVIGKLLTHYYDIVQGLGLHKNPTLYGAFPTDAYSHTPAGKGTQQPGMTGQVKEDILCRFGELGIEVSQGRLGFNPLMLRKEEFLNKANVFSYVDVHSKGNTIEVGPGTLIFTYCQVPIIYKVASEDQLEVILQDGTQVHSEGLFLDARLSNEVLTRSGQVKMISVNIKENRLR
jgi:hypothetical protein